MTRFAAIVLALSLTAGGALAASPEADYLEARDKAIAEVKALENSKASESAIRAAMDKALADLTKRLKDIVGPVSVKGFPGAGRLNLDTLSENQVGYGNLDGVAYGDNGPEVVVTTRSLVTAWLEGKAKDEDKESRLPTDVEAAVRQENFYSGGDVAFAKYADLPVTKPAGAALAVAALGLFRQDNTASPPDTIVATIVKGDRVFVASIPRTAPIGKIPACEAIWTEASRKADKLQAEYVASGLKNKKLFEEGIQAQHQGDGDAHACFNARAPKQSFFAGLTKEAQSLVDRLALSSKDYINDYPERLAEFQKDQAARRKEAKEVGFSEVKMDDAEKSYPFLREEFQGLRTDQKKNIEYIKANPDKILPNPSVSTQIAESRGKIDLLFIEIIGGDYCGQKCTTTVYADEGSGYKKTLDALTYANSPVYVTRTGGQVFLYLFDPNVIMPTYDTLTAEWILKDHQFVENKPPGARSLGCGVVGSIRSEQGTAPAVMVFEDSLDQPISIYWINYNGERVLYKDLQPGGSFSINTYFTHPWLITRQDGACLDVFVPSQVAQTIAITGTPPAALQGTPEASAKPANSVPSGPAAQVILQWFTTDRSLGCNDQQGNDSACTVGANWPELEVYYGDSTGGGPQADALAFVYYGPFPGGNMMSLAVAYFHRDGGNYRFIKTFPNVLGTGPIKGTTVRFLPGKANFSMAVLQGDDSRCCPTGRANYTVTLNPTFPTSPAAHVRHYENVDAPGNDRGSWIRGVSSADCESICITDSGCAGYTYNRSRATCIPKSIVVRLIGTSEPAVTGVVEGR